MTNYEWLVSTNQLTYFLSSVRSNYAKKLIADFGMNLDEEELTFGEIAEWLQAEHVEKETFVKLKDIKKLIEKCEDKTFENTLNLSLGVDTAYKNSSLLRTYCRYILDELSTLKTKEIEE